MEAIGAMDDATELAVLYEVLDFHPAQMTLAELLRAFGCERGGFAERDAVERAVRDLDRAGLLHRNGELLLPTRAALRFCELADR